MAQLREAASWVWPESEVVISRLWDTYWLCYQSNASIYLAGQVKQSGEEELHPSSKSNRPSQLLLSISLNWVNTKSLSISSRWMLVTILEEKCAAPWSLSEASRSRAGRPAGYFFKQGNREPILSHDKWRPMQVFKFHNLLPMRKTHHNWAKREVERERERNFFFCLWILIWDTDPLAVSLNKWLPLLSYLCLFASLASISTNGGSAVM